jgi:hypothetical protein
MATAFIIRPFGSKQGIDFDQVERELIGPALATHRLLGRTTGDSLRQGNIRTEMFQRLLMADVVIVDISIGNANVYYELGIRHALRNKHTFMIRGASASGPSEPVPFDLRTDRYLSYPTENPAEALALLCEGLRQTLLAVDKDSPVFQLLPELQEQDRSRLLVVPADFQEDVERARNQAEIRNRWGDLLLLRTELLGYQWRTEGLRLIGRAQVDKQAYAAACDTWETIRQENPRDQEANIRLGTIYQRLGDLTNSTLALQRVLTTATTPALRAESYALMGSNWKTQWQADWKHLAQEQQREAALSSPSLLAAFEAYQQGFLEDLNHYYAGINALSLLTIQIILATAQPEVWSDGFANSDDSQRALQARQQEWDKLRGAVTLSLEAAKARLDRSGQQDAWLLITLADLAFLTSDRPRYVATQYRIALTGAQDFAKDTVRRQLQLYQQLGVRPDHVTGVRSVLEAFDAGSPTSALTKAPHTLLFTGHQIDAPDRPTPRFPADQEEVARQDLREVVAKEKARFGEALIGIAGGASGGDILFHEVCRELGIPTLLYLAMPRKAFVRASVQKAGPGWLDRFDTLYAQLPKCILTPDGELPLWLQSKPDYSIWQRNNLWTLYHALALGSQHMTLIALWDQEPTGDGPGGTQDMVAQAQQQGAQVIVRPTKQLFGLA